MMSPVCRAEFTITVLKGVVEDIHLIGAEHHAKADFVLATDQVEGVPGRIDVGPPLIRSVARSPTEK